ncbi:transposase-like zinc-binding domain-containing protein [Candidatus Magnetominusculus dajiuhuensis]|uniref:IS1/IS1595 family N-terminal zinc-binding domain-containing protein n=1 Tax=Candidatus Magnetominusculus dajiuhuensis TaxID=3137712 RepID=UPI0019E3E543|nr:topoisomerase DNA-binding C4 zinc finger domain-containing protein [Nitrospirota bacterium]
MKESQVKCPVCGHDASYRYGKTKSGKPRRLCLVCGRQFSPGSVSDKLKDRPKCPVCGRPMHLYMKKGELVRFRCSAYPSCRTFLRRQL